MGTTNRYCFDCGSRLIYYATLSNPKAPNEYRVLTYSCPSCTKDFEKPKLIQVTRNKTDDPISTAKIQIIEYQESGTKTKPPEKNSE